MLNGPIFSVWETIQFGTSGYFFVMLISTKNKIDPTICRIYNKRGVEIKRFACMCPSYIIYNTTRILTLFERNIT